jgi:hypothetical protein
VRRERLRDARIEAALVDRRRLAERLREAAVRTEQLVELAGEPGGERVDDAATQPQPLRVRARHAEQPVGEAGAERLRLFAAQHVGLAAAQAADDRERATERGRDVREPRADGVDARRHVDVGRLHPRAARAHHAAGEHRRARPRGGPVADRAREHRIEPVVRQADRAVVARAPVADRAVGVEQPRAQPRRAPVDRDHAGSRVHRIHRLLPSVERGDGNPRATARRGMPR